ncbi:aminoacyl-tRNA hydrolase [Helicobacter bizzozeronii]|uniref:aminoacyl-tRNA hydrolase n=1 Tax=Helicobacter bizzozeronii TaxID=56877 RepID=UPI0018F7FA3A|nr:aminoacyl-tRNA hydrolase [Helicobacter bizzozeronii]
MMLIVGLGNPTPAYAHTRHNVGFDILDSLAQSLGISFMHASKYQADYAKVGTQGYLLKPMTYMNLSGQALAAFLRYHDTQSVLIVHDDLDLPLGAVRFKSKGGHGGHNGLKSIEQHYPHPVYKMKIGIGRSVFKHDTIAYVLQRFSPEQEVLKEQIFTHARQALEFYLQQGDFNAMQNRFTLKPLSP